ncbi:MAG TPA: molecular chaperone SurA [Gammaproteobacteria bacterium]|jgi:peptidyl-prolyl cis-trans isomerase SurA|nr:molecular chaperone SurA [Gammaproteobacteria bacterium]|tara:strand:- start:4973 stop:6310 length:1338 start_codon:yes stop_codon:yes gene_type:complete
MSSKQLLEKIIAQAKWPGFSPAVCVLALLSMPMAAMAQYQKLDGIVAVVDDDVVLASELMDRLDLVRRSSEENGTRLPPNDVLVSQIMERLILENLQRQEADRRGLNIDDETLSRAVAQFAQNNNLTLDEFRKALLADGNNFRQFREDIREEMLVNRLQRALVSRRISITEQDVQGLLNSPYYQQLFSDEYRVGHIMITLEANASDEVAQQALEKADGLVATLREGAEFAPVAMAESSASSALEGGDMGWRKAGELPSLFAEPVMQMSVGDIAQPIVSGSSIHIIKLLEQRGAGVQKSKQTKVRHILVRPSEIRTPSEAEGIIRDLHQQLDAGGDFIELATQYSEDPGSALNGGDLGWSTADQFVGIFSEVMQSTSEGAFSEPFLSQFGWHVLLVEDRREQDMSDEARRNMALELLHNRRFEEERQEWLKELRDEAFVEIRLPNA